MMVPTMMPPNTGSGAPAHWQPGPPMGFMPPVSMGSALPPPEQQPPPMPFKTSPQQDEDNAKASPDDSGSDSKTKESEKAPGGGFLSSLFGWKKTKSNQAILPDDKEPSIVWDEKEQKWKSADGTEEINAPPPPPPKMGDGRLGPQVVASMRQGARRTRYVNTENSKISSPARGAPPPMPGGINFHNMAPIAAPIMPSIDGIIAPPQQPPMMIPAPSASIPQSQDTDIPPMDTSHSHEADEKQGAAVSGNEGGSIPMMAPPSGGGQIPFFNPAQMKPGAAPSTGGSSQQRRLGANRRVYPTQ